MWKWAKRLLAYLLISSGLVLLFLPLNTNRILETEKEFLFLESSDNVFMTHQQVNEMPQHDNMNNSSLTSSTNAYTYPIIHKDDLTPYPSLSRELDTLQRISSWNIHSIRLDTVSMLEWNDFSKTTGISEKDNEFEYGKYIFKGYVKKDHISAPVEVENLNIGCKAVGTIFFFLGLFSLTRCYTSPPEEGIRVGKRSAIIIWDIIIILFGTPFTWWFVDFVLSKTFHTVTEWSEDFTVGMGIFWIVLAYPLLSLITTATSIQTLKITNKTILLKGMFRSISLSWDNIESIHVIEAYSPRKIGNILAPHRGLKLLEVKAANSVLRILEAPYISTKKQIITALMENAPENIKPGITTMSKEWLSKW